MTEMLSIKIRVGPTGVGGSVVVDGQDLSKHIAGFVVDADVHHGTSVRLDFINVEVDLEGVVDASNMGDEWATYRLGKIMRDEMTEAAERGRPT